MKKHKNLLIRLLRKKNKNLYHIVVVQKRAHPMSNLDSLGKISKTHDNQVLVHLNLKKLTNYLYNGISISLSLAKILGIEIFNSKKKL